MIPKIKTGFTLGLKIEETSHLFVLGVQENEK